MDMNLQKYLAFVKTVEYGSFTKAAEMLNYSQSGVSRMIHDLEREWKVTLLERGKAGVRLTSDGLKLLPYAENVCREYEKLQMQVDELNGLKAGLIRIGIFIGYIKLISRMDDIKRTFMYHGSEHKCINCLEHGLTLSVENVRKSSKEHKRCGTSFLLIVMVISILFFMVIRVDNVWLRILSRIILIPVIAGVSYEVLRLAGTSNSKIMDIISRPGLWMQGLTTKEPDDSMIEVAIAAVEQVFDWKSYLEENFPEQYPKGYFKGQETDGQECRAGGKGCKESGGQESGR